jgi:hypothetical protein
MLQHDALLAGGAVFVAVALYLAYRRGRVRWWAAWMGVLCVSVAAAGTPRTPAASPCGPECEVLNLPAIESIDNTLALSGKPVLVEVYSDNGFG